VLSRFYAAHHNQAAGVQDMLDAIAADTGFDATALAERWLR
jgi:aminopeptidase N